METYSKEEMLSRFETLAEEINEGGVTMDTKIRKEFRVWILKIGKKEFRFSNLKTLFDELERLEESEVF